MGSGGAGAATEIEPLPVPPAFDSSGELSSFSSTSFSSSFAVVNWLISSSMGTWESRLPTISYEHFNKEKERKSFSQKRQNFQIFFVTSNLFLMGKFTTNSLVFSTLCKYAIFSLSYSSTGTTTKMEISPSCPSFPKLLQRRAQRRRMQESRKLCSRARNHVKSTMLKVTW